MVFYEVFSELESIVERLKDSLVGEMWTEGLMPRKEAFEKDLEFYLGKEWRKGYKVRKEVQRGKTPTDGSFFCLIIKMCNLRLKNEARGYSLFKIFCNVS